MHDRVKHIIESGLMESYLLNQCTDLERIEIESLLEKSEDLRSYYSDLESLQFEMAQSLSKEPPSDMKNRIHDAIHKEISNSQAAHSKSPQKLRFFTWPLIIAAACFLGMILFLMTSVNLFIRNIELQNRLNQSENLYREHSRFSEDLNNQLDEISNQLLLVSDPTTQRITLEGNSLAKGLRVFAYWNKQQQSSLLLVSQLPELTNQQCYQLWADVDGEMLNLGIVKDASYLVDIPYLENAESLNITIEPEGGSEHPTVSHLVASQIIV